ncbi:GAP family protein [Streptomyces sp. NBC_01565]|uniref:GAP family protein n=1 Tax=Streptomyces sp. NBC_01565 TaxID=2975881 RepID=UPI00225AE3E6|nr:GAP family protein [Streptomyces sp. NBC_01565]MCX4546975.1 GAP family protein [Streptomyces sp. NBC_01565]
MLIQAVGAVLPMALAVALSPFPVIGTVLILAGRQGRRNGLLFAAGWIAGLGVAAALVVVVFGGADDPESPSSAIADWGRVFAGAALIVLGARTWWQRPRAGDEAETPRWMASLDDVSALRALVLGLLLSGANPKNLVLTASAATSIVETGAHDGDLIVAVTVFVLVGSCTVLGAVIIHLLGGQRAASFLESVRQFMITNSAVITAIVLLLLGASILGEGLSGLGR